MKPLVQPRGNDRWAAQGIGADRAEKLYDLKGDAVAHALAQAKAVGADLVIEDGDGRIVRWERHDADQPRKAHAADMVDIEARLAPFFPPYATATLRRVRGRPRFARTTRA